MVATVQIKPRRSPKTMDVVCVPVLCIVLTMKCTFEQKEGFMNTCFSVLDPYHKKYFSVD